MLIPVVISSIPIKIVWAVDCGVTIVKNSERIEKNIKSTPILTKRSRQVSQMSEHPLDFHIKVHLEKLRQMEKEDVLMRLVRIFG